MIRGNVDGTANLVNACLEKQIEKLCYVSSTAALGSAPAGTLITEDLIWSASTYRSAYSISKYLSEMEVWRGMAEGLDAVIVNPHAPAVDDVQAEYTSIDAANNHHTVR